MTTDLARDSESLVVRSRHVLSGEAVRSAVRFSVALLIADAVCVAVVGDHATALFGSFAVIAMLYFCDFDGSITERSVAYVAVWAVSVGGILVGTALAGSTLASVIAATLVAAILAFVRIFRGFIARSSVAVQLPFLMCLLLPAQFSTLLSSIACWTIGSAVALVASHLIFPRHRRGKVRGELSAWCSSMATLCPLVVETSLGKDDKVPLTIESCECSLLELLGEGSRWPGVLSRRLRALTEMALEALGVTLLVDSIKIDDFASTAKGKTLAGVTQEAFEHAAGVVSATEPPGRAIDVASVRRADVDRISTWALTSFRSSVDDTISALRRYHVVRVLSMASDEMQRLAMRSVGSEVESPSVGFADVATPAQVLRGASRGARSGFETPCARASVSVPLCGSPERSASRTASGWHSRPSRCLAQQPRRISQAVRHGRRSGERWSGCSSESACCSFGPPLASWSWCWWRLPSWLDGGASTDPSEPRRASPSWPSSR